MEPAQYISPLLSTDFVFSQGIPAQLRGAADEDDCIQSVVHWVYQVIQHLLASWGYLAVAGGVLGEDAGLPVPGETTLMFAAFVAHKHSGLNIYWVVLVGVAAAIVGDNLGFLLGRHFGGTFIRWAKRIFRVDDVDVKAAKDLIKRHGGRTIFFSRFIFGLRTIAGPMAGSLDMEWKRFLKFNALGAAVWVTTMSLTGYAFANEFNTLLDYMEKGSWAIAAGLFLTGYLIWRRQKHKYRERESQGKAAA